MGLLIAVPAYNEEKTISKLIKLHKPFGDVILFNNNSSDKTVEIAKSHEIEIEHVLLQGYENVIFEICNYFLHSKYKYLLIVDGDDEVKVIDINKNIDYLKLGYDGVIGRREVSKIKRNSEKIINYLFKLRMGVDDIFCGWKLLTKGALSKNFRKNTFATSILNKKSKFYNQDVIYNQRNTTRLGSNMKVNLQLLICGINGLIK
jgi:cellulose synthase/poly-beta-1,6-N-acetylglucosamine synthase-like glycosyltransferase